MKKSSVVGLEKFLHSLTHSFCGLSLFTRYKKVLNASGSGMKIHDALELIYQEILGYLKEKNADSEADTVQLEEE